MRVPLGFVVEGLCEHQTYELLIRRGIAAPHGKMPIANAWGNGGVRKDLEERLVEVVKVGHPCAVIVTLDMQDALDEGAFETCEVMRLSLQERCDHWLKSARGNGKLSPLPEHIVVVIQAPVFEVWLAADVEGLHHLAAKKNAPRPQWGNVDSELSKPVDWLDRYVSGGFRKKPQEAHRLAKVLHPARMARSSRSFEKFWKEVHRGYQVWSAITGAEYHEHI